MDILKLGCYTLLQSVLRYGLLFWGNSSESHKSFNLHKEAMRIMASKRKPVHCKPLFQSFENLPLPCFYIMELTCFFMQHVMCLHKNLDRHTHDTRNQMHLQITAHNTQLYASGVKYMGIKIYSNHPVAIKSSKCPSK